MQDPEVMQCSWWNYCVIHVKTMALTADGIPPLHSMVSICHSVAAANALMMSVSGYLSYVDSLPMRAPAGLFGLPATADHDRAWAHAESALQV